jgi:hypothetical protein
MIKIKLNWPYSITSPEKIWEIDKVNYDISISIDNTIPADYLILYESRAITPRIYDFAVRNMDSYKMIFTHNDEICDNKKIFKIHPFFPSWIHGNDINIHEKKKVVSMIASTKSMCNGHLFRNRIANSFSSSKDLYGNGRNNQLENKADGLRDYMFSIAMENDCYDTYYTEKLLDCFLSGTIPIYWGSRKISDVFDINGVLFLEETNIESLTPEIYKSKINSITKNFEIAKSLKFTSGDMIDYIIKKINNGKFD